jgi:protoporphyrin/coproporphyrin ferrochelatase
MKVTSPHFTIAFKANNALPKQTLRCYTTKNHPLAAENSKKKKTSILMANLGGPKSAEEVGPFLHNLFTDRDIIQMPFQSVLAPLLAKRRTPVVGELYKEIGYSPIYKYTKLQGEGMINSLQTLQSQNPNSFLTKYDFSFHIAFRYSAPRVRSTLEEMAKEGIERAILFSQYPQFSCTTAGSSLNELWSEYQRFSKETGHRFEWSLIDRWPTHPLFISAVVKKIREGLAMFSSDEVRKNVKFLFSAHSLPIKTVAKGDQYPAEVAATVYDVMKQLKFSNPYSLVWQSQVGRIPWLGPQTAKVVEEIGKNHTHKYLLVIPIAFTSDHIETLSEIDIEMKRVADEHGILEFHRSPSLNDDPAIFDAFANIVKDHLENVESSHQLHSLQYTFKCPSCQNPACRTICDPAV